MGRLYFEQGIGGGRGATGFLLHHKNKTYLVTAFHIFFKSLTWESNQAMLNDVRLIELIQGGNVLTKSSIPLRVSHPKPSEEGRNEGDVALFKVDDTYNQPAMTLAERGPILNEPVWLYYFSPGEDSQPHLLPARVLKSSNFTLDLAFPAAPSDMSMTSGSPVLNSKGEVVGVACLYRIGGRYPMEMWAAPLESLQKSLASNE